MATVYRLKKHLSSLACRFILGCIGHSREISPIINPRILSAIRSEFGPIEEILPPQDFPNPPESYYHEMGAESLSTIIVILEQRGAYTDLHYLKEGAMRIEEQFHTALGGRIFNINPGAVGTYGLSLASHKPTEDRPDGKPWRWHHYALALFGSRSYYERIMRWQDRDMVLLDRVAQENRFPEYHEPSRMRRFGELVQSLPRIDVSFELMHDS